MTTDWIKIHQKYKGLWVGLEEDEVTVIASGKTAREVVEKAREKGYNKPTLLKVPTSAAYFIG